MEGVGRKIAGENLGRDDVAAFVFKGDRVNSVRHLYGDFSDSASLPCEWVEDEHWFPLAVSVNARSQGFEGVCGDFIGGPANLVVVFLSFLVDCADARASGEIVKLIEEDMLPCVVELFGGIGSGLEPRK